MAQPWSTIAEHEETGALSYEMHIPFGEDPDAAFVIVWDEAAVRDLIPQLEEFLLLVEERSFAEAVSAADSGGH